VTDRCAFACIRFAGAAAAQSHELDVHDEVHGGGVTQGGRESTRAADRKKAEESCWKPERVVAALLLKNIN
jgi:hypothetical protein